MSLNTLVDSLFPSSLKPCNQSPSSSSNLKSESDNNPWTDETHDPDFEIDLGLKLGFLNIESECQLTDSSESSAVVTADDEEREYLFEKILTPTEVGKGNRLVVPKKQAKKHFPFPTSGDKVASVLSFEDELGKEWSFRYSFWNACQSYVLTNGWRSYVQEKELQVGDVVWFEQRRRDDGRELFIRWRRGLGQAQNSKALVIRRRVAEDSKALVIHRRVAHESKALVVHRRVPKIQYIPSVVLALPVPNLEEIEKEEKRLCRKRKEGYLGLLVEAARLISGNFKDDEEEEEGRESDKISKKCGFKDEDRESEKLSKKSRVKAEAKEETWIRPEMESKCMLKKDEKLRVDVYEDFENISPIVRSKRGRSQALPSKYRDSVLEPLNSLCYKKSDKGFSNPWNK